MARARPARKPSPDQLTLDYWARTLSDAHEQDSQAADQPEAVAMLAEALAPRLAEELSQRIAHVAESSAATRLLTLDELVAELPPAKRPQTWKRWLYERTRRGEIPGCVKLGGMLFFERESALAWLRGGAAAAR
jgi:hypothetical protein